MKRAIFLTLSAIFIFTLQYGFSDDCEVLEDALADAIERIERDRETIRDLREARNELEERVWILENQIEELEDEIGRAKGLFVGAGLGYPVFNGVGFLEYRFNAWSPVLYGGYNNGFFVGIGLNFRVGK